MAVEFNLRRDEESDVFCVADRHLYLDRTESDGHGQHHPGSTVVEEGDPRSAFQFVARGHPISKDDAARLGLSVVDGKVVTREQAANSDAAPDAAEEKEPPAPDERPAPPVTPAAPKRGRD
jgi:hypothetical protein